MGGYVWPIGRPIDQRGRQVDEKGENKVLKEATRMPTSERAFTGGREKKGKQKRTLGSKKSGRSLCGVGAVHTCS